MPQSAGVLDTFALEESAKVLIILDLVRHGWKDPATTSRLTANFSDHVPRGIYVEATSINPGSLGELRRFVETLRPSHYLDGPNDVDWVYRNRIEAIREEALYVDLIKDDEGYRWVPPRDQAGLGSWRLQIVDTLLAMGRLGLLTTRGLEVTADAWTGTQIVDTMTWWDNASRNLQALKTLWEMDAFSADATDADSPLVQERWAFPMGTLDLRKKTVSTHELDQERAYGEARLYGEWIGDVDDYL